MAMSCQDGCSHTGISISHGIAQSSNSSIPKEFDYLVSRYPGIKGIHEQCTKIYPDQENPLQVQSILKIWRGGPNPLDYVSMYNNEGNEELGVPAHWHYVTYGLSDLHCDGRVFQPHMFGPDKSGFGFELTIRIQKLPNEDIPPVWPSTLLQTLARYVFNHGQALLPGDHVSWHQCMNSDDPKMNTQLQQILLTCDPQLDKIHTKAGQVEFVQVVPVTTDELILVQKWNVNSFLEILKSVPQCGGPYLVTDMNRMNSVLELRPDIHQEIFDSISQEGSALSGVSAIICSWTPDGWLYYNDTNIKHLNTKYQRLYFKWKSESYNTYPVDNCLGRAQILHPHELEYCDEPTHSERKYGQRSKSSPPFHIPDEDDVISVAVSNFERLKLSSEEHSYHRYDNCIDETESEHNFHMVKSPSLSISSVNYYYLMHITLNLEAAYCFPLMLTGRLRHGRHFTFKSISSSSAITLVPPQVDGSFVSAAKPFGAYGLWLQVFMCEGLIDTMIEEFEHFFDSRTKNVFPKTFIWPQWSFGLTILPDP